MTSIAVSASAATAMTPIFSSDQASDRVRGITGPCRRIGRRVTTETTCDVRSPSSAACAELRGVPFERDPAVLEHDELRLRPPCLPAALSNAQLAVCAARRVLGDVERVAQLVRDDDRADALEVAQLDDLLVDGQRRDRIEAGRRLVVEQDARLRGHRPRDRDAPPLPARELRRHAVDELAEPDEAQHFLDPRVDLVERPVSVSS